MMLILASTSRYRKSLLERLNIPFSCLAPDVDETPLPDEPPEVLATRLAEAKALAVAQQQPSVWVLGSDQVACVEGELLGKPGNHPRAVAQLKACSGKEVYFYTAVALVNLEQGHRANALHTTRVRFRPLAAPEIERYLQIDQPYDCAGSFKCESLGITLFESIVSDDPTGLEGLPLITTCNLLRAANFNL